MDRAAQAGGAEGGTEAKRTLAKAEQAETAGNGAQNLKQQIRLHFSDVHNPLILRFSAFVGK